ncbi:MAG TPA: VIT domain-containing protein [Thermotogota bacterium]|nr:VWA domain-containing protein [Thermotogota bacterium]HNR63416.1 VIT domain-containing protein [Thermotogota bacterium]HNT95339.1 VIT domain-containing protein [Thermotogota bacterium]
MKKSRLWLLILVMLSALLYANGVIIPFYEQIQVQPIVIFPKNPVSMLEHLVHIDITEDIAKFTIQEVFYNESDETVEVVYLFPIPDQTFVTDFKMTVGGVVYEGAIMEKDEARALYESYVRQQKDPALLEYIDKNMIRIRIFPFAPYEKREIQVEYHQEVVKTGDYYKLVYPLKIDTLLKGNIGKIKIEGVIHSNRLVYTVNSPTHTIAYTPHPQEAVSFIYAEENLFPSQDFVLFIGYGERQYEAYFVNDEEESGKGTFMLDILPYYPKVGTMQKNVIVVLDKSGSMYGQKYEQAVAAAQFVLARLNQEDRFGLVLFNDMVSEYRKHLLKLLYDQSEAAGASKWLDGSEAGGGTDIYGALHRAMISALANHENENNYVIFLTDGQPTSGITNISKIASDAIAWAKGTGTKMFIFGVGYDVNTGMLDLLAQESGGMAFYVDENENVETKVSQLFSNVSNPLMTDIQVEIVGENAYISDVLPSKNLTIYKDFPLKLFGHYSGNGEIQIKISGKIAAPEGNGSIPYEHVYTVNLSQQNNPYISKLWASRRISELLNQIKLIGETTEAREEIIRLSKKYGIPTPYTSYLILEGIAMQDKDTESTVDAFATLKLDMQARSSAAPAPSLSQTGQGAFEASKMQNMMVQSMTTEALEKAYETDESAKGYRNLYGKLFLFDEKEKFWVDTDYEEEEVIEVQTFSEAYFDLISRLPELKNYLSLGSNIKIQLDGVNYRFKE